MKQNLQLEDVDRELEIIKAVAQAWYSHSGNSQPMSEFDARRRNYKGKSPSRFKLEAMRKSSSASAHQSGYEKWDFGQSLWDAYEIVAMSKRLETGLVLDELESSARVHRKRRESKHSLRSFFNTMFSRRFDEADMPPDEDT
ncbi:uncharacterized protein LOC103952950 [Pyrus x bretschneideri]|uniref:uncharacterized protein LOC103952950 n=1 Tax=Pyrus x bretschneideri TaxID=225117 RepID=UPI00202EE9D1|nr:uncharacterized protein LOC103952950 [Pyrus x bretschneideri]